MPSRDPGIRTGSVVQMAARMSSPRNNSAVCIEESLYRNQAHECQAACKFYYVIMKKRTMTNLANCSSKQFLHLFRPSLVLVDLARSQLTTVPSSKRAHVQSALNPLSGSAVQSAAATMRPKTSTAAKSSTSQRHQAQDRVCHLAMTPQNTSMVLFQRNAHGSGTVQSCLRRPPKAMPLLIANGLWTVMNPHL